MSSYSTAEWRQMTAEAAAVEQRLAALLAAGVGADHADAREAAEAHRMHISRWFYDCSFDRHRELAELYRDDDRFAEHLNSVRPGLAQYLHDAILANVSANQVTARRRPS